jgi:hypothetical protein
LRPQRLVLLTTLTFLALGLLLPASSSAQQHQYNFSIGLLGGIGGSPDADPDLGVDNFGLEAFFSMETSIRTRFVVRAGQMGLESDGGVIDTDLNYLTLSGEYEFHESSYEAGLFIGLGLYELDPTRGIPDESSVGLTIGTTGDIRLTDRLSVIIQISGHYVDFDYAQFFVMGHAGLAFHF